MEPPPLAKIHDDASLTDERDIGDDPATAEARVTRRLKVGVTGRCLLLHSAEGETRRGGEIDENAGGIAATERAGERP